MATEEETPKLSPEQLEEIELGVKFPEWLTAEEHRLMDLSTELAKGLFALCGEDDEYAQLEIAHEIHTIQNRILAQAAGRAYPDRYRALGE